MYLRKLEAKWYAHDVIALKKHKHIREAQWTESVAVGSKQYVEKTKEALGFLARGRKVKSINEGAYQIKETQLPYCPESENTAMDHNR